MKPNRNDQRGPAQELRYAWGDWQKLERNIQTFLSIPDVQRALVDDAFRIGGFQKNWGIHPKGLGTIRPRGRQHFQNYLEIAEAYRLAVNHTMKSLDRKNSQIGMRNLTQLHEQLNFLIRGSSLESAFEVLEFVQPREQARIEGLQIHAVLAVRVLVEKSQGRLNPDYPRKPITETHALHTIVSHENPKVFAAIPRYNSQVSENVLRNMYRWDEISELDLDDRMQGVRFRVKELCEFAEDQSTHALQKMRIQLPAHAKGTSVIAEVNTEKVIQREGPTFFQGQWGIGLIAPRAEGIDMRRGHVKQQIEKALPHIAHTILHYPKDSAPMLQQH